MNKIKKSKLTLLANAYVFDFKGILAILLFNKQHKYYYTLYSKAIYAMLTKAKLSFYYFNP